MEHETKLIFIEYLVALNKPSLNLIQGLIIIYFFIFLNYDLISI